jgi:hypothetical protein
MSMNKINLYKHPDKVEGSGLYRTLIVIEVLSDREFTLGSDIDLEGVVREIEGGDFSGLVEEIDTREISHVDMSRLLEHQESDPEFLLGEKGWVYKLDHGDEVKWNDPDDGKCSRYLRIGTIEFTADGEVAKITDIDGGYLEAHVDELE